MGSRHAFGFGGAVTSAPNPRMSAHFSSAVAFGDVENDAVAAVDADEGESTAGVAGSSS